GFTSSARNVQRLLDTWEHARRFMQHEGPLFAEAGDKPHPTLALPLGWWEMLAPSNLLGADILYALKHTRNPFWFVVWLVGIALIPVLVVFFSVLGISQTIAWLFKSTPKWPADMIASVGGRALRGKELERWREIVPDKTSSIHA
ncbi:MAG TPA: hypothetical protein VFS42_11400, partial [Burkholderiaceae bacterium]|nr:hypothetical protein [Burkholderiaceae bacterium]